MYCCSILDWSVVVAQGTVLQFTLHLLYSRRITDSGVYEYSTKIENEP